MKTNLISSIASWKSAALLGLVALIATVAFSGVLSTPNSADAATRTLKHDETRITVAPGDTIRIEAKGTGRLTVTFGDSSSDDSNAPVATIPNVDLCYDGATGCDKDPATNAIAVETTVPNSGGSGFVSATLAGSGGFVTQVKVIRVAVGTGKNILSVTSTPGSFDYSDITYAEYDATTDPITHAQGVKIWAQTGADGDTVTFKTSQGNLSATSAVTAARDVNGDGDTADVGEAGWASVDLYGPALPGKATVTATIGTSSKTVDVTVFGPATKITVEERLNALGVNNQSTMLVVTVKDDGGNPVSGQTFVTGSGGSVTVEGPSDKAVAIGVSADVDDAVTDKGATSPNAAKSIPACNDDDTDIDSDTTGVQQLFAEDGTNDVGQCVIEVKTNQDTPANAKTTTTRGAHTITVSLGKDKASDSVTINVGGPPASITSDAPERVDALDEITVTVTVWDDADVPVGKVAFSAERVSGDGLVETTATETKNGKASFTYTAGLAGSGAVIRITAGTKGVDQIRDSITIAVGPAPVEPPAMTWSADLVSGWNPVSWLGEDGASLADNTPDGVTAIYQYNTASQSWAACFPGAEGVSGGCDISSLDQGGIYWVYSQ